MKDVYTLSDLQDWSNVISLRTYPIRLGVVGYPVAHSLSPQLQNAALRKRNVYLQYARFEIAPAELAAALERMPALGFVGVNLTIPHKVAAMSMVDEIDENAKRVGAINTIHFTGGKLRGFNTDGLGFSQAIQHHFRRPLSEFRTLLLGAGGAARAIGHQCVAEGASHLSIWNRRRETAMELCETIGGADGKTIVEVVEPNRESLGAAAAQAELIINATPVGLRSNDAPLLCREALHEAHCVYDTIYRPRRTQFLMEAEAAGAKYANGLSMLLYQGAQAFTVWFGRPAPVQVMRTALRRAALR